MMKYWIPYFSTCYILHCESWLVASLYCSVCLANMSSWTSFFFIFSWDHQDSLKNDVLSLIYFFDNSVPLSLFFCSFADLHLVRYQTSKIGVLIFLSFLMHFPFLCPVFPFGWLPWLYSPWKERIWLMQLWRLPSLKFAHQAHRFSGWKFQQI